MVKLKWPISLEKEIGSTTKEIYAKTKDRNEENLLTFGT